MDNYINAYSLSEANRKPLVVPLHVGSDPDHFNVFSLSSA